MKNLILLSLLCLQAFKVDASPLFEKIEQTIPSVVFIAGEFSSFDYTFNPAPGSYAEYIRPAYEYLWPPTHHHGTGFLIGSEGYIVTNAHVVNRVTSTFVALVDHDIRVRKASVVGIDQRTDLAVLKIEDEQEQHTLEGLQFGDSDQVKIGQDIAVVGNPVSTMLESSVTVGIISGRERRGFGYKIIEEFLQTDASINPGNSGGPVINDQGEVIGIVSAGFPRYAGLNFVIPSQVAKKVVHQLIEYGKVSAGYLGVSLKDDREVVFNVYRFDRNQGAIVEKVYKNSPAEACGLCSGDVITRLDGHPIRAARLFVGQLWLIPPFEKVELTVVRDGKTLLLEAELSDLDGPGF